MDNFTLYLLLEVMCSVVDLLYVQNIYGRNSKFLAKLVID